MSVGVPQPPENRTSAKAGEPSAVVAYTAKPEEVSKLDAVAKERGSSLLEVSAMVPVIWGLTFVFVFVFWVDFDARNYPPSLVLNTLYIVV